MEIMSVDETASFLHCSSSNIRNMIRSNQIPYFRLGARIYFTKQAIIEWLHSKEIPAISNQTIKKCTNKKKHCTMPSNIHTMPISKRT